MVYWDQRGAGSAQGNAAPESFTIDQYIDDTEAVLDFAESMVAPDRIFLLGHSNGGQVVLRFAIEHGDAVAGVIVSNPSLRIAMPIPPAKLWLGRMLMRFAPWITLKANTPSGGMTSDPHIQASYRGDRLRHDRISPPLFFGMVEGGASIIARAEEIHTPLLLVLSGGDIVVDPVAGRAFFERVGSKDKTLSFHPEMLHEPLNDIGREAVIDEIIGWLSAHLATVAMA